MCETVQHCMTYHRQKLLITTDVVVREKEGSGDRPSRQRSHATRRHSSAIPSFPSPRLKHLPTCADCLINLISIYLSPLPHPPLSRNNGANNPPHTHNPPLRHQAQFHPNPPAPHTDFPRRNMARNALDPADVEIQTKRENKLHPLGIQPLPPRGANGKRSILSTLKQAENLNYEGHRDADRGGSAGASVGV